jgi:hypothetical protein
MTSNTELVISSLWQLFSHVQAYFMLAGQMVVLEAQAWPKAFQQA